jgi:hypothetical protein
MATLFRPAIPTTTRETTFDAICANCISASSSPTTYNNIDNVVVVIAVNGEASSKTDTPHIFDDEPQARRVESW